MKVRALIALFLVALAALVSTSHRAASNLGRETADLGPGANAKITQDKRIGRFVVFENQGKVLRWERTGTVTGVLRVYAVGHHPDITPDGKYVVYDNGGYVYRNHRRITKGVNPAITAAGVFIAFERDGHIYLWNGNTNHTSLESRLTDRTIIPGSDPELSFHGNWLVFESNGRVMLRFLGGK